MEKDLEWNTSRGRGREQEWPERWVINLKFLNCVNNHKEPIKFVILEKRFQIFKKYVMRFLNPFVLDIKLKWKEGFLQKKMIESCYWCHYKTSSVHSFIQWMLTEPLPCTRYCPGIILGACEIWIANEAICCLLLRKGQILLNKWYVSLVMRSGDGESCSRHRDMGYGLWSGQTSPRRQHYSRDLNQAREKPWKDGG